MSAADLRDFFILSALWGASFLFIRLGAGDFGPIPLIALRVGIASLFLLLFLKNREDWLAIFHNIIPLAILGITYSAVPFTLVAYATLHLNAGFASIINATTPIFGMLVAVIWLKDRCTRLQSLGLLLGFTGVWILVSGKLTAAHDGPLWLPVLSGLGAALSYGVAAGYSKRYMQGIKPLVNAVGSQLTATAVLIIPAYLLWPESPPSAISWFSVALLGLGSTGVAYLLFFRLVSNIGPQRSVMVTYLVPVFAMTWGALLLDESIELSMLLGCAVTLLGTALATEVIKTKKTPIGFT